MELTEVREVRERLEKIEPVIEIHKDKLTLLEPLVHNHELLLRGDRKDRHDQGIVGAIESLERTGTSVRKFLWIVGASIVISAISFVTSQSWAMYVSWLAQQSLNP